MTRSVGRSESLSARRQATTANGTLGVAGQVAVVALFVVGAIVGTRSEGGLFWFVPFAGVGALLVIRRPRTSIGWILMGLGLASVIVTATLPGTPQQYADRTIGVSAEVFAVVQGGSGPAVFFLFATLATVFPSGRLPQGRWGVVSRAALATALIMVVAAYLTPAINVNLAGYPTSVRVPNPLAVLPDLAIWRLITLDTATFPVISVFIAAAVSLVVRARRARGTERQQLRWFAGSIAFVAVAVLSGFAIGLLVPGSSDSGLAWIPAIVAFPCVPLAVGIAVLRYRLYEIDRIISRTLTYGVLTVVLAGVYVAGLAALQALLAPLTSGGGPIAVAASTLAAFALFQPLRRRLQAAMDRRFNRSRYDAQRTVDGFAAHLRDEIDLERLGGELRTVVGRSLAPTSIGVWLRPSERTVGR
jgi:MFS family permease